MQRSDVMQSLLRCGLVRVWFALMLVAGVGSSAAVAQSSDDSGIITISVTDAATKKALADARITLFGATQASALTNRSGVVKYIDVPTGLYRIRVVKGGFSGNTSAQFEILGNKEVNVDVGLAPQIARNAIPQPVPTDASGMKVIGRVSARVSVTTRDVDSDSAIRRVSDSLTDALSKIAGVDITQTSNDPDAAQTISLNGHDESQTAVTLDGIPLGAPGSAVNLRAVNTDLFGGASVSFAAQAGSLGGAVNFRTLQPTQTWVSRLSTTYGTFDKFNYQFGETGSIGKLGIAVLHTLRESNNPLTFNSYTDQSGLRYAHAGESSNVGDFLKLRYGLGDKTTVNFTALQNNAGVSSLCTQDVTLVPCGIGPGNTTSSKFHFMYGSVQSLVGDVTTTIAAYVNANSANQNDASRYINGVADPLVSQTSSLARGIAFLATVNQGSSTWTFNGSTYDSLTSFLPAIHSSPFVVPSVVGSDSQTYELSDLYKINDRLAVGPNLSLASTNGSGASIVAGLSGTWRPTETDTYAASASVGSSQPRGGLIRTFSDPAGARFNCAAATADVNGPGDQPGRQSALSYDANWTHQWAFGSLTFDVYRQRQAGQLIEAQIVGTGLGFTAANPYIEALQTYFSSPYTCGSSAVLDPANVYVNEAVGDTTRLYQGFTLSGRLALGPHLVAIPSYQTNGAAVIAADARLAALNSTTILGAQIPGRPVHRGNLTLDGDLPHAGLELLANLQYVGSNNAQHIDPYALLSLAVSHSLGLGRIALLETNVFGTESAPFSSLTFAQPILTTGGGLLYTAANPNPPRQFNLTYSFNTGSRTGAGGARPSRAAARASATQTAQNLTAAASVPQRARGLGSFTPFPPPAGVDPLSVAERRDSCSADDAIVAQPILAELRAAAAAYQAGEPLPFIDAIALVAHGDRTGRWYFEVRPKLPPRPESRATGGFGVPRAGGRSGEFGGPPPGEGGPGAGGPGFGAGAGEAPPALAQPPAPASPVPTSGAATTPAPEPSSSSSQRVLVQPRSDTNPRLRPTPDPAFRAAFAKFRATLSCAYFSALAQSDARNAGYTAFNGRNGLGYSPRLGLFVVRAPELGTGGGSLKQ